jgi:hypothetical protein
LLRAFDRVPNFRQGGIHVSKEPQGIGLSRPSLTAPGDLKRPARDSERVVPPAAAEVGIAKVEEIPLPDDSRSLFRGHDLFEERQRVGVACRERVSVP